MDSSALSNSNPNYASGLTAYNKDGLEILIHKDGSVYWQSNAGARMLGMQNGHLSSILNRGSIGGESLGSVVRFQNLALYGIKGESFYDVDTLITLAKHYCPDLAKRFSQMGANVYLYQLAGYSVGIKSVPNPKTLSDIELMELQIEAMNQKLAIAKAGNELPGFKAQVEHVVAHKGVALPGKMTLGEMAEKLGKSLDKQQSQLLGRSMSANYQQRYHTKCVDYARHNYKNKKGDYQSTKVLNYPMDMIITFASLCEAHGI